MKPTGVEDRCSPHPGKAEIHLESTWQRRDISPQWPCHSKTPELPLGSTVVMFGPRLLSGAMSGSMTLHQLDFLLMSVAPATMEGHIEAHSLSLHLRPC